MRKAVKDLGRVLVSELADLALDVEARARRRDKQVVLREVLDAWALERHAAYRVFARSVAAKGLQMELDGLDLEDDGEPSKVRK